MTDKQIIAGLRQGDKSALNQFYQQTYSKLSSYISSRVDNPKDAEEITQDTYLSFIDSFPLYRSQSCLYTFLISIAKHEIADFWRRAYAKKAILTVPFMDQLYTEPLYSSAHLGQTIISVYQKLLPQEVQILKFKYEQGFDLQTIASKLNISLKAAESRLFRARQSFKYAYLNQK